MQTKATPPRPRRWFKMPPPRTGRITLQWTRGHRASLERISVMSDQAPRSALEIAMERLRQKDAQDGVDRQPRTDEQKAAIAEVRSLYDARIAQAEVLYRSAVAGILDETARARLEEEYQRDRARLQSDRDARVEKIRRGDSPT
jgi:hypothetical protein